MKKYIAGAGVAAALLTGSVAVAAVSPIGFAGAQDTTTSEAPAADALPSDAPPAEGRPVMENSPLSSSLDELVAEGVISQEQADAVRGRVEENRSEWEAEHPRVGKGFDALRESAQAIADVLGLSVEDVMTGLRDGSSLNDLAAQQGVDPAAVSQVLIDTANARIDQAVVDGKLTQEKADEIKAKTAEHIDKVMDGSIKGLGFGGPGFGGRGPGGPGFGGHGPDGDESDTSGD